MRSCDEIFAFRHSSVVLVLLCQENQELTLKREESTLKRERSTLKTPECKK